MRNNSLPNSIFFSSIISENCDVGLRLGEVDNKIKDLRRANEGVFRGGRPVNVDGIRRYVDERESVGERQSEKPSVAGVYDSEPILPPLHHHVRPRFPVHYYHVAEVLRLPFRVYFRVVSCINDKNLLLCLIILKEGRGVGIKDSSWITANKKKVNK